MLIVNKKDISLHTVAVFCTFIIVIKDHHSGRRVESYNMAGSGQGDVEALLVLRDKVIHNPDSNALVWSLFFVIRWWEIAICEICRCFQVVFFSCWKIKILSYAHIVSKWLLQLFHWTTFLNVVIRNCIFCCHCKPSTIITTTKFKLPEFKKHQIANRLSVWINHNFRNVS